jgi:hypothetical protein
MKKQIITMLIILFSGLSATAQVGISATNTPPNTSAMLDVSSTNKGLLPPRMSTAQRNAIASPADGLLVFDITTQSYWYRRSSIWTELPQSTAAVNFWQQTGAGGNEAKNTNTGGLWSSNPVGLNAFSDNVSNPPTAPVNGAGTRMMWIPSRSAFRVGTVYDFGFFTPGTQSKHWDADSLGLISFGSGLNTRALGYASTAMGNESTAKGWTSSAFGNSTFAIGDISLASGWKTKARGIASTSLGYLTQANGNYSTALGNGSIASGESSIAMGNSTIASNSYSTAIGNYSTASGGVSTAIGFLATASGYNATSIGNNTVASGNYAVAIGLNTVASGENSTAMGYGVSTNFKFNSFAIGGSFPTRASNNKDYQMSMHFDEFNFFTGNSNLFTITDGLIRTSNSLLVYGSSNPGTTNSYFSYGRFGSGVIYPSAPIPYTIYADGKVFANEFNAVSDARHKKLLSYSNNISDLALLKKLKVSNYTFIDTVAKGKALHLGFIAQEVEEVVPEAIHQMQEYIPSVYQMASLVVHNKEEKKLTVTTTKIHEFSENDDIKLFNPEKEYKVKVSKIIDKHTFIVNDWVDPCENIFVFGKQVNDFRVINYNRLFMLGISSIQYLAKENDEMKKEILNLKKQIADFHNLKERLDLIEANLKQTTTINQVK